jgi:outer membrane protein TolC
MVCEMARIRMPSALLASTLGWAVTASALQPLDVFVAHAHSSNPDVRVARATAEQRAAEASVTSGRLLPSFTASGTYTRNQYEVSLTLPVSLDPNGGAITIQPQNQLDASLVLSVPVIDIGAWDRRAAAAAARDAAEQDAAAADVDVERRVTRAYYQLIADEAVLASAERALGVAKDHLQLTHSKIESGTASELDARRGEADVARAEQDVAAAGLALATGRRDLASLSGLEPEPGNGFPEDDLHDERPLADWMVGSSSLPSVASAEANLEASQASARAATAAWLPTLSASATERFTNAPSFVGHSSYFLAQATASWKFDASVSPASRAQAAAVVAARARADKSTRDAEDAVFRAWHQVRAGIDSARSARAQVKATALAADLARDRYASGVATQLDVLQAEQDAFRADVTRIQMDADLAYARAALRLWSGQRTQRTP